MPGKNYARSPDVTAIVQATLADERWFGDGPPQWLEGRGKSWERPCETAAEARQRRESAARKLTRANSTFAGAGDLAERLDTCGRGHRCLSGACPECNRALQRAFVVKTQAALTRMKTSKPPLLVSIVPDFGGLPLIDATKAEWKTINLRLRKAIRQVGITTAMLGTDFSVNTRKKDKFIQAQFWGVICDPPKRWRKNLKPLINASQAIKRPLRSKVFDGYEAGLACSLKTTFERKTWIRDPNSDRSDRGPSSNTRNRPLQGGPDWVQLMLFLDDIGLDARILLIGARRIVSDQGVVFAVLRED
jgi:hypothetical protein